MATTPQGNFAAYKELKYREQDQDKTVDFINLGIERLIKEGKARDAVKLKRAQEEGKSYYDAIKDIKIEPHQTTALLQGFQNKLFYKAFDEVAESQRIAGDTNLDNATRQKARDRGLKANRDFMAYATFMVDPKQVQAFTDKAKTDTSKIWKGDKSLGLMRAIEANAVNVNDDGSLEYLDPNDKSGNPYRKLSISEATQLMMNPYTQDVLHQKDGLYDQMREDAKNMTIEIENGIGGNRTTKTLSFNKAEAEKSFDTRFGSYDRNNKDVYLQQFADEVLNGGEITSQADYDKVKQAYVDKLDSYVKEERSIVDKHTAAQLEGQRLSNENTKAKTAKLKKSIEENNEPIVANEQPTYVKQYKNGNYIGYSVLPSSSVVIPGTQNSYSVIPFEGKDGKPIYKHFIGGLSKEGRMTSNEIIDPKTTIEAFGKNVDVAEVMVKAFRQAEKMKPISSNKIKVNYKNGNKESGISLDIKETQIAPKAKSNTRDKIKDFENNLDL